MNPHRKIFIRFLVCLFALGSCVSLAAEKADPSSVSNSADPADTANRAPPSGFNNQQIIETWGWIIAQEKDIAQIEIDDVELSAFLKGVAAAFKGERVPYDLRKIAPDVEKMAKARREKFVRAITEKNEAEAKIFFAGLDKRPNVGKLPGGIRYEIVKPSSGPCPKPTQTVNVHFIATLLNGTEFLQMGPYDVVLVNNQSIPFTGWVEAMQKINKGGVIKFYVPPPLPENEAVKRGIPPGSTMIFETELLDIKDTSPETLADSLVPPAPEPEAPPPSGYSDQQIIETWGWDTARRTPVARFGLSEADLALLTKGLTAGVKGQPPPCDLKEIFPSIEKFVTDQEEQAQRVFKQKQLAAADAFFAGLKQNKNIVEAPSGLRYEILKPGSGPFPAVGNTVVISYVARLLNGKVFERTDRDAPRHIEIGTNPPPWLVSGWLEGLQKINKGGKIRLYIPDSLAYGDDSVSGIPPNSALIFEIELLDIKNTPPHG